MANTPTVKSDDCNAKMTSTPTTTTTTDQVNNKKTPSIPTIKHKKMLATGGINKFVDHCNESTPVNTQQQQQRDRSPNSSKVSQRIDRARARRKDMELLKPGPGILARAQLVNSTAFGLPILRGRVCRVVTLAEQEQMKRRSPIKIRMLLEEPFNQMSIITDNIGLTGLGGLVAERFEQMPLQPMRCVINVTYEAPIFNVEHLETYRVPVADDKKEDISIYFDEVNEKLEEMRIKGCSSVVHCMAGVSRSATLVMAYLIRYQNMNLQEAFEHTKTRRTVINPNLAFLEQLARYEAKIHSAAKCTPWIEHTVDGVTRTLPDFIVFNYLEEYSHEFETDEE